MMKTVLLALLVGTLSTFLPFILTELTKFVQDRMRSKRIMNANKADQMRMLQEPPKRQAFNSVLSQAMHDRRLAGKQRPIMVPDKTKIKELKDSGQPYDEDNPPMKPLQNSAGETVMEWSCEKYDPRFDQLKDGKDKPIMARIYVDPGKGAPTYTRQYKILILIGILIGAVAFLIKLWSLLIVPVVLGSVTMSKMLKRGKECEESNKILWEKLQTIYTNNIRPLKDGESIHSLVDITEWACPNDDLYVANARTKASEDGLSAEPDQILPKPDPKTGRVPKPRRAEFQNVPCKMTIYFDANFMQSGCDALLKHLNQNIGGGTVEWVAQKAVAQPDGTFLTMDGWDFDKMKVDLMTLPPLPDIANLPEDLDETPWNVIRIGRTVTGEAVWDLSGQGFGLRPKRDAQGNVLRDEYGQPLFPASLDEPGAELDTIHHGEGAGITCPMALVPLDVDTNVWVVVPESEQEAKELEKNRKIMQDAGWTPADAGQSLTDVHVQDGEDLLDALTPPSSTPRMDGGLLVPHSDQSHTARPEQVDLL